VRPRILVGLVHWNAPAWCAESIGSALRSDLVDVEAVVVNNGGALPDLDDVEVIDGHGNLGFAAAANLILDTAVQRGVDHVFVGCHDIVLAPDSLHALVDALESDPGLGVVGPVLDGAGGSENDLDWINGSGFLVRGAVARQVRFDERYETYVEDVDFCYRVRDLGWRVGRCGDAHATTHGSVDERAASVLMHANALVFFAQRHMGRQFAKRLLFLARQRDRQHIHALALGLCRMTSFPFRRTDRVTRKLRSVHAR
jgi:GT2 family glycosyltransferase